MDAGKTLAAVSAAAVLIAGVTGAVLAGTRRAEPAQRGYLAAHRAGIVAKVPWQTVGPGWELAEYSATRNNGDHPGPTTLYLINPAGGRYQMHRWAASHSGAPPLSDWSADKTQAVFLVPGGANTIEQLNLRSGRLTTIRLRQATGPITSVAYADLDGRDLLVTSSDQSQPLREYSMAGFLQRQLPGAPTGGLLSPDGRQLVEGTKSGLRIISGTGRTIRTLRVPGCSPVRYWTSSSILAFCAPTRVDSPGRLLIVPADGRAPRALSPEHVTAPDLVYTDAWKLPGGTYLQAASTCEFIARQRANGKPSQVNVPGTSNTDNVIVSARGGRLLVQTSNGCETGSSLLWFNPASGHETWLLRASHNAYGVTNVVPFASIDNEPLPPM